VFTARYVLIAYIKQISFSFRGLNRNPLIWLLRAPDQGSMVDFFLFFRLKSIKKAANFSDVAAIQERVTAVFPSIPKEAFADSFQKIYKRCQRCVVKDGD
jgi:hypothetical protein